MLITYKYLICHGTCCCNLTGILQLKVFWVLQFFFFLLTFAQCNFFRKNAKVQKRGKINLIGRLQLTTERMREEENEGIVQLRILRTQASNLRNTKLPSFFCCIIITVICCIVITCCPQSDADVRNGCLLNPFGNHFCYMTLDPCEYLILHVCLCTCSY